MKRKKLLKVLAELLDVEGRKQRKHHAELKDLLRKLRKKRGELEKKVLEEKDKYRKKRLNKELEIVNAQYAKGLEVLKDLEKT